MKKRMQVKEDVMPVNLQPQLLLSLSCLRIESGTAGRRACALNVVYQLSARLPVTLIVALSVLKHLSRRRDETTS